MAVAQSPYEGSTAHETSTHTTGIPSGGGGSSGGSAHTGSDAQDRRDDKKHRRKHTRRLQRQLRNKGFKVSVDGIFGPETKSALRWSRKGRNPQKWNKKFHSSAPASSGGGGGGGSRGGGGGGRNRGGGGGGRNRGGRGGGGMGGMGSMLIKPGKFAKAVTNQQYAPIIRELRHQQDMARAEREQNLADIGSWFDMLGGEVGRAQEGNAAASEAALSDYDTAAQGIAAAFGGGAAAAAPGVAEFALAGRGFLSSLGQSQSGFDQDMAAIAQAQENDARLAESRYQDQALSDLARQIVEAKRERGNALTVNRFQAQDQRLQQMAAMQNMAIASQMAGVNLASAKAGLKGQRLENKIKSIQVGDLKDQIKNGSGGAIPAFNEIDPGTRSKVEDRLRDGVTGPQGGLLNDPQQVLNQMGNAMRRLGWDPQSDKAAKRFRDSILRDALSKSHASGSWRKWRIVNNRLISPKGKVVYRLS